MRRGGIVRRRALPASRRSRPAERRGSRGRPGRSCRAIPGEGAVADVAPVLHAVEADAIDDLVGPAARHANRVAKSGDAKDATAVGQQLALLEACAGLENTAVLGGLG